MSLPFHFSLPLAIALYMSANSTLLVELTGSLAARSGAAKCSNRLAETVAAVRRQSGRHGAGRLLPWQG